MAASPCSPPKWPGRRQREEADLSGSGEHIPCLLAHQGFRVSGTHPDLRQAFDRRHGTQSPLTTPPGILGLTGPQALSSLFYVKSTFSTAPSKPWAGPRGPRGALTAWWFKTRPLPSALTHGLSELLLTNRKWKQKQEKR